MTRPRRAAVVVAGVVLVLAVAAVVVWLASDGGSSDDASAGTRSPVVRDVAEADAPFASLTEGTITVGDRHLRVAVADDGPERIAGLRGRADAAPYDGMLFVFGDDTTTAFTMAGVPSALEIAFFAGDGSRVDRLRMEPCAGSDATCPVYRAAEPFRYALETAPGEMPDGPLQVGVGVTPRS